MPSRRRSTLLRAALVIVLVWGVFAAWLLGTAWRRVPLFEPTTRAISSSPILTGADYAALIDTHPRPFVYRVDHARGAVLVFGAEHTMDPADPQLDRVRSAWDDLGPTIALIEGRLGMMFPAFMDPVRTFGETGAVHALARRDAVPTYSWEPPPEAICQAALDQGFTPEQVALRLMLNPYFSNLRHGRPDNPEAFVADRLPDRARWPQIADVLTSVPAIDEAWARHFPNGPDWRDVSDQFGLPGVLGQMDLNTVRDEHLLDAIASLLARGERVYVIAGSSHAVKLEPAIRSLVP